MLDLVRNPEDRFCHDTPQILEFYNEKCAQRMSIKVNLPYRTVVRVNSFLPAYLLREITVVILNFWKDRSGQTVQTQIRLHLTWRCSLIKVCTVCYSIYFSWRYHTMVEPLELNFKALTVK